MADDRPNSDKVVTLELEDEIGKDSLKNTDDDDDDDDDDLNNFAENVANDVESPFAKSMTLARRVKTILGSAKDESDDILSQRHLFIQLNILCHFDSENMGWKEMSRWLKYEEKVDAGGRWSKPHVSTISLHGLSQIRWAVAEEKCVVILDLHASSNSSFEVYQLVANELSKHRNLNELTSKKIMEALQSPHKHKYRRCDDKTDVDKSPDKARNRVFQMHHRRKPSMSFSRRKSLVRREGKDLWSIYTAYPKGDTPDRLKPYKPNKKLMNKLPSDTEVANILVGLLDNLDEPIYAFCRLETPVTLDDTSEVTYPSKFLFLAFGRSPNTTWELIEVGRAVANLLNDRVFREVAYKATSAQDLLDGIDEYTDSLTILPPSIWDPSTRLDPPVNAIKMERIAERLTESGRTTGKMEPLYDGAADEQALQRSGRLFGGLCKDVRTRYPHYRSDFVDGLNLQCLASAVFLYFACITPIVTFGGLMDKKTGGNMGTMEMLLSGAVCGIVYALFSGQPLTIVGATGPLLVFEEIVYKLTEPRGVDFMSFRLWIGFWVFLFLLLIVAFDLSSLIRYITRFTEECFAVLISIIFIYEALSHLSYVWYKNPVHTGVAGEALNFTCHCDPVASLVRESADDFGTLFLEGGLASLSAVNRSTLTFSGDCIVGDDRIEVRHGCIGVGDCSAFRWNVTGEGCQRAVTDSVPDIFLLSCVLQFGTFAVAIFFRNLRSTRYFPFHVRSILGDFAVFLAVVMWTGIDAAFGLNTAKLNVPVNFQTTIEGRGWLINPLTCAHTYWWLPLLAALPGVLATILIFLDQQITAVIVNRKEHKLAKGFGYHLDLLVLAVLIAICSILGIPWFCAATVRSISHVRSLIRESDDRAPGERPVMLGIREQRLTGISIHLLIGISMLSSAVLKYIPMPVLYGVFLYMGITSLAGVQFVERILIILMPIKYQPDYIYLRHVQTSRVHGFTIIQMICSASLWAIKSIQLISIAFPIMLLALMGVRRAMDYIFTQRDLFWLDHLLPDEHRRKREDILKAMKAANMDQLSGITSEEAIA